jgi:hypothetical protein
MTVGGIVLGIIASVLIIIVAFSICAYFEDIKIGAAVVLGAIVCLVGLWYSIHWYYTSTASGLRAVKTQDSEFNNGIERQILVYDMDGDVIEEFRGKFDVEYTDERILFDDETGCRHIIYFKSGTVVVNEIKEG